MVPASLGRFCLLAALVAGPLLPVAAQSLPPVPVPSGNPLTTERALLGKILFWDEQLSSDNSVSCGTCHRPASGGADPRIGVNPGPDGMFGTPDDIFGSPGVRASDSNNRFISDPLFRHGVQATGRTAPSFINAQWSQRLFWDGRAESDFKDPVTGATIQSGLSALESQAVGPILSAVEMAHGQRDWTSVIVKLLTSQPLRMSSQLTPDIQAALLTSPTYPDLFTAAFGDPSITPARIGQAIATYERSLVSDQTPFDRFVEGDPSALTPAQQRGLNVFRGQGLCNFCHLDPHLSDDSFHNIGLRPASEDPGREGITGNPADFGAFKTPQLRNFSLKATYMHNGRFTTVREVVDFYDRGGDFNTNLDPVIMPLGLSMRQKDDLVDFLENGLVDPRVAAETAPFDRPRLYTEDHPFGSALFASGVPGTGGITPKLLADYPMGQDTLDFKLGIIDGLGGETAYFFFTLAPANLGTMLGGFPVYVSMPMPSFVSLPLSGFGPGGGFATIQGYLPSDPALVGQEITVQAFLTDPGAPLGATVTSGAQIPIR